MMEPGGKRIVVLGGGFAGVNTMVRMERLLKRQKNVSLALVSNENFFLYTPMLHEVATGAIETRHIAHPLRRLRGRKHFDLIMGSVRNVDLVANKVVLDNDILDYDILVLALGSTTNLGNLPNASKNIFTLKNLRDGMVLRNHVIRMFEEADATSDVKRQKQLLTFVVVGGGSTGVQLVAEMRNFVGKSMVKGYRNIDPAMARVMLIEAQGQVLSGGDVKLSETAYRILRRQGIDVRLDTRVTRLWDHGMELNHLEMESSETVVWAAGIVANPVVGALPVAKDEKGRVVVDQFLRVPGHSGVYALGDNAHFEDPRTGVVLPPRAHYAVRQPKTVVYNIFAELEGKPPKVYRFQAAAELVSLGPRTAAMKYRGVHLNGILARIIWLVGYLSIMMGLYNRTRVAIDWLLAMIYGRDNTLLSIDR